MQEHEAARGYAGEGPLSGVLVLDFSHYLSGPTGALMLADLGAEVIKIESAERGDDMRRLGPLLGTRAAGFAWANRNKRGLALDLKTSAGLGVARELAARADVLIENFSTGVMPRLGLGSDELRALNPRLVYCSVCGYARAGELGGRPGFDPVLQAEAGLMALTGHPDREGVRTGVPVVDMAAGFLVANAALAALLARHRSGRGDYVEISLYDTAITLGAMPVMNYLASGIVPERNGNASRDAAPTDVYRTADAPLYIACPSESLFRRLAVQVLERPELAKDARFRTNAERMAHAVELRAALEAVLVTRSSGDWVQRLRAASIPAGIMRDLAQVVDSPEFAERQLRLSVEHGDGTSEPGLALPLRLAGCDSPPPSPAPALGEHTGIILREVLGYEAGRIEELRAAGAFGEAARETAQTNGNEERS